MPSLWFVTPALGRTEISSLCYPVLRWCLDNLPGGVEGHCVVVGDDENLDLAERHGFVAYPQQAWPLGRKFNDGFTFALSEGADWIVPMNFDNWVLPRVFDDLPGGDEIFTATRHVLIRDDGRYMAHLHVYDRSNPFGIGPFVFPRHLMAAVKGRPVADDANYGIDFNTISNIMETVPRRIGFKWREKHPLQLVGFKHRENLTGYDELRHLFMRETSDHWSDLARVYPQEFVDAARSHFDAHGAGAGTDAAGVPGERETADAPGG